MFRTAVAVLVALPILAAADGDEAVAAYEARIAAHAARHGSGDRALIEEHVGLAFARRRAGDHAGAAASFARAVYLERVHKGLEHPDQIPLIERLVESNRARGAWRDVAANLTLLDWVNRRARTAPDARRRETLARLARWHLEASAHDTGHDPYTHLATALDTVEEALAEDPADAATHWLPLKAALSHAAAAELSSVPVVPAVSVRQRRLARTVNPDLDEVLHRQRLIAQHFVGGREALEQARERADADGDAAAAARATQLLGDWHHLFGRRQQAGELYAEARRRGAAAGIDLFATPRRLPDFLADDAVRVTTAPDAHRLDYVRTRFDVDKYGRAHNIEILETQPPHAHDLARRVREQLRTTRYRPRFDGDGAVATDGVEIRFIFPPAQPAPGASL